MATNFWSSSHYKRWIVDRATLHQARYYDLQYADSPEHLGFLNIFFANLISKLGKKLQLRQRVIATATVFFRRFYVKNSYCETDPFIVIAACCYVAAKAEEAPVAIRSVVTEARTLFGDEYGIKTFPSDNSKLAEMEFYLVDELECDLTVFHPYRTLVTLCGKEGGVSLPQAEAGEADADDSDGPRYWGTGEGKLELQEGALQMAWYGLPYCPSPQAQDAQAPVRFIINDTYRSELCLLYPPHLIAIAAIYLTLVFHAPTRASIQQPASSAPSHSGSSHHSHSGSPTRRSSRSTTHSQKKQQQPQDVIGFMAGLNVSMTLVATIAQEIISLYALWDRYSEDVHADSARSSFLHKSGSASGGTRRGGVKAGRSASVVSSGTITSGNTPSTQDDSAQNEIVTPMSLVQLLLRMREQRMTDLAHPPSGRPVAVNKMLERTQAAG
ncbi:cyclin-like protein [Dichomitus squalens LYAD-421 SS1]|uniref:cyclin-like protein n=1 Tax=Dichomitus squalens (strain LYAD-421) TaxID=732165 RepID=UPI000441341A|nr:cyclin-like protein [Dichomitus squalens LYAD-421 SS1]EJF63145.1 cyclin-like protein [Dichomitus squalens LYAD-421 SS1]